MIPASVDYVRATSLDDALAALETEDAKVLAGGQSLLPAMKLRLARPALLVDVGGLGLDSGRRGQRSARDRRARDLEHRSRGMRRSRGPR